eukprot:gb/GECG01009344.1/.p1 GENE.gb/GECG01009344.1/~~gb/GECG01009344.1/.p1  ORF type:complete len:375 (+),score=40.05 gb/GECG01009344.1/:1-1125(+)
MQSAAREEDPIAAITPENILRYTSESVDALFVQWGKAEEMKDYLGLIYALSLWKFVIPMEIEVGEVARLLHPLINRQGWCRNKTYSSWRIIDLVRSLGAYVDKVGPGESFVTVFPEVVTKHEEFQRRFARGGPVEEFEEWRKRTTADQFEYLAPFVLRVRMQLLTSDDHEPTWDEVLPALEGSALGKQNAAIEGIHDIPAISEAASDGKPYTSLDEDGAVTKFKNIIRKAADAKNVEPIGMTVRRSDWPRMISDGLLKHGRFYIPGSKSAGEDGVKILSWGKHVVAFQWKRYEATTRLDNLTLFQEAEKTLTQELTGCSDFVSLVVFSTSSQVKFTHLPKQAKDNEERIFVPGGSVLKHECNPRKGRAQTEKKR